MGRPTYSREIRPIVGAMVRGGVAAFGAGRTMAAAASRFRSGCSMLRCAVVQSWRRRRSSLCTRSSNYAI